MVETTGNHPKAKWPGVYKFWGFEYDEHPLECLDLFDATTSRKAYEELVETIGYGLAPVKGQNAGITFDDALQSTVNRATHVAYALGYAVTHEEMEDNLYDESAFPRAAANAFSQRQTKEVVAANFFLNNAFSTTFGDGVALLASTHPTQAGNQSNILSSAADLTETSIEDLTVNMMNAKNARGLNVALIPQSLHVSTSDWYEANRILGSVLQSNTANNDINVLKATNVFPGGIKLNHYFTDTDAWAIRSGCKAGMTLFDREKIGFSQDNDFSTKNALAASYTRYSFMFGDWRTLYGTPGS